MAGAQATEIAAPFDAKGRPVSRDGREVSKIPGVRDYYLDAPAGPNADAVLRLVTRALELESDIMGVAQELSARYEEIDLLYSISEVLGRTIGLTEAGEIIVRDVSSVVGARRASIFVYDPDRNELAPVAGWGLDVAEFTPIPVEHPHSIAARVFRENAVVSGSAETLNSDRDVPDRRQAYRGNAFLSAPITYPDSDGRTRPVGVINLTDRLGADQFSAGDKKLIEAIAHQVGAAVENARLVALDRQRQRVRRELELAHDLQLRLLPSPDVLAGRADVAARCRTGELVGGDFYQLVPLTGAEVGVMLGDVSTHGFPAALIMALVLSAAGIHAAASSTPEGALQELLASVESELATTGMYLSLFYAVVDSPGRRVRYANAGHPHAFLVSRGCPPKRLGATSPPLGLVEDMQIPGDECALEKTGDLLVIFSDGMSDARDGSGAPFTEDRVLNAVIKHFDEPTEAIVEGVFEEVDQFAVSVPDDQTLLVLRT